MNDDEAEKCLSLAKDKFRQGHLDQALKFARKAKALNPTFEAAEDYIDFLLIAKEKAARESARGNAATAQAPDSEGVRHRPAKASASASTSTPPAAKEEPTREYTAAQVEAVKEVLRLKGDYYKCLGVERTCTEVELKKAYRKQALAFHPDKNGAPGAESAFKVISRAMEVLSDERMRRQYDQTGVDPGSRQQMAGGGGGGGGMFPQGAQFEGGMTPEELFNMFFGGGGQGFTTFSSGGPGFQFHVHRPGRRPQFQQQQQQEGVSWGPILPLLIILFFSLISSLFSGPAPPAFALSRTPPYINPRTTAVHGVRYFVNPSSFPYSSVRDRSEERKLRQFEQEVENSYFQGLQRKCQWEMERKRAAMQDARGFFSVDQAKLAKAQSMKLESCEELRSWQ